MFDQELRGAADQGSQRAHKPDFRVVAQRSRDIRRARLAGAAFAAASLVAVTAVAVGAVYDDQAAPTPPANPTTGRSTPTPTPDASPGPDKLPVDPRSLSAEQIVDNPDSHMSEILTVPAGSATVTAVVWEYCATQECRSSARALAVSSDEFETRHVTPLRGVYPSLQDAGDGSILLTTERSEPRLLMADGTQRKVALSDVAGSLAEGERLVAISRGPRSRPFALNASSATAHPLSVPPGYSTNSGYAEGPAYVRGLDGTISFVGVKRADNFADTYFAVWSHDGGVTWSRHELTTSQVAIVDPMPSYAPGVLAFVESADGATYAPYVRVYRSTDGGLTWESFDAPGGATAYYDWGLVQADGSLLLFVEVWSDARPGRPGKHPLGLYETSGKDWSALNPGTRPPTGSGGRGYVDLSLAGLAPGAKGSTRIWLYDYRTHEIYESGPGIDGWRTTPAR